MNYESRTESDTSIPADYPWKSMWIKASLIISAFIFLSQSIFHDMVRVWSRPDYSHGFLIPFISLYYIWLKRADLRKVPVEPGYAAGVCVLIAGGIGLILGKAASVVLVQIISLIVVIIGLILLLGGEKYLKALALPVLYLLFAAPIFDLVYREISLPLQIFFSSASALLLRAFNVPVFQHAQFLELPRVSLEVAPECSGMGFLISFVAIGIPLAYFTQKSRLRRSLLVLFAVFCCIMANLLRITLIGLWSHFGGEYVHGPGHILVGTFMSVVGFIFLFVGAWIFSEVRPGRKGESPVYITEKPLIRPAGDQKRFNGAVVLSVVILLSIGGYLHFNRPEPVPLKKPLQTLSPMIGNWEGHTIYDYNGPFAAPGADSKLVQVYRDPSGQEITLSLGYFDTQNQGKEIVCDELQMLYDDAKEIELAVGPHRVLRISKVIVPDGPDRAFLVLYWHDINGRVVADRYLAKLLTALDGALHGRTNGALVIAVSTITRDPNEEERVLKRNMNFLRKAVPVLDGYLPGHHDQNGAL